MTTPLRLFTSNRLERLAGALGEVLRVPLSSPLDEEIILVQSRGMERWVSTELAQRHGICANCTFPFPNTFVYEVFREVLGGLPESFPFEPKIMTWKIMKLLPGFMTRPGFETLRNYLKGDVGSLKRFQLSERIAHTFDQYLLFRPEMILRWEEDKKDHWQATLWRALVKGNEGRHRPALAKAFFEALKQSFRAKGLPERVSVFGISALPRFHMAVLAGISPFTQVNLFLMNPCKEYWGHVVSDWEIQRTIEREGSADLALEGLHLERGNSLLASMGRLGRDFFDTINELDCQEVPSFEAPGEDNLLSCLQSDILHLRDRAEEPGEKIVVCEDDVSIQVHSCHSPMREIEVLHDWLLNMFEKDPSLLPKDILVMTPDIETYAFYVQAVFGVQADEAKGFPFTIADRSVRQESDMVDTFLKILGLHGSRFGVSEVLALLECRPVRGRFGLSEADLETLQEWVRETKIRWGIDGEGRAELGLPPFPENTWRAGLERLLLGYAMAGQEACTFEGVLPYDHVEGGDAAVLGRFLAFAHALFDHVGALGELRTLDGWAKTLIELLDGFFLPHEDTEDEMQFIRRKVKELGHMSTAGGAGYDEEIDLSVIKWHLGRLLEKEGLGFGFMAGGITFCAMLPMRSIPFKVICLIGMNGSAYPRQSKPLGFDLMARRPKPGDRSRRNDDRYLFLEALLSAREKLYISYVGQSIQDNTPVPPSVLVSELMDYIEEGFVMHEGKILDHMVFKHRLQAFSPEYFKGNDRLFSYSVAHCRAAQCLLEDREDPLPFISRGLSAPEEEWKTVSLDDLCGFFANPARFLLNRRLGIRLEQWASVLEDRETFELKGLERYLLEESLVKRGFSGLNLEDVVPVIRAAGRLPHGAVGECMFEALSHGVERFVQKTRPYVRGATMGPVEIDLHLSDFHITGTVHDVSPERLIQYRYAKAKAKDRLRLWIHHLVLNTLETDHYPRTSMLVALSPQGGDQWAAWEYLPVEKSGEILGRLLQMYWRGLVKPLCFFPESSWSFAEMLLKKNRDQESALNGARKVWMGSNYSRGEGEDAYYQLCFKTGDPLGQEFQDTAEEVFRPILKCQKEIS